jgi:hypothetical protein
MMYELLLYILILGTSQESLGDYICDKDFLYIRNSIGKVYFNRPSGIAPTIQSCFCRIEVNQETYARIYTIRTVTTVNTSFELIVNNDNIEIKPTIYSEFGVNINFGLDFLKSCKHYFIF